MTDLTNAIACLTNSKQTRNPSCCKHLHLKIILKMYIRSIEKFNRSSISWSLKGQYSIIMFRILFTDFSVGCSTGRLEFFVVTVKFYTFFNHSVGLFRFPIQFFYFSWDWAVVLSCKKLCFKKQTKFWSFHFFKALISWYR